MPSATPPLAGEGEYDRAFKRSVIARAAYCSTKYCDQAFRVSVSKEAKILLSRSDETVRELFPATTIRKQNHELALLHAQKFRTTPKQNCFLFVR